MWSNSLQEEGTKIQQVCIVMEKKQIQTSVYKCLYRFFFFFLLVIWTTTWSSCLIEEGKK